MKRFVALSAFIVLSGCGFDEGAERLKCQKTNLDEPKVEECVKAARLAYDESGKSP